jgi:HEAT repeat protein
MPWLVPSAPSPGIGGFEGGEAVMKGSAVWRRLGSVREAWGARVRQVLGRPFPVARVGTVFALALLFVLYLAFRPNPYDDDDVVSDRELALDDLGQDNDYAIPALRDMLKDETESIRDEARAAVTRLGPRALPVLRGFLREDDVPLRRAVVGELAQLGEPAVPTLIEALRDRDRLVRARAAQALGAIGPGAKDAVPALCALARDESDPVGEEARAALARIRAGVVPALQPFLKDGDVRVRRVGVAALSRQGVEAVPALIEALGDGDWIVRRRAARALGGIGPRARSAVPALRLLLRDDDPRVRDDVEEALERIGAGG